MTSVLQVRAILVAAAVVLAAGGAVPAYAGAAASSAFGISASLTSEGSTTGIGPIAPVQRVAPPAYDHKAIVPSFSQTVGIAAGSQEVGTLEITAGALRSHVASSGFRIDNISAQADSTIGAAQFTLQLYPPPPGAMTPFPQSLLSLSASKIAAAASGNEVFPQPATVSGAASIGKLTVSGSLIGGKTLTFSGTPAKNTVLYSDDAVTITLNQEVAAGLISCGPTCIFTPTGITTDTIAIHLHNVNLFGHPVSGDILVGQSRAQLL
jgi:hypothetical protein